MNQAVSVVIPCHNAAGSMQRQVDALLPQLEETDELLLVDNRSADGTRRIAEEAALRDARVRVLNAPDKAGANHARNIGAARAHNPIILFCDADDVVHSGWVRSLRQVLGTDGIAGGSATPVDEEGRRLGPDLGLHETFGGPAYPLGATMGVRREVLETIGGFDESYAGGHDETDLAWRAARAGWPTHFVPEARIDYVQRPDARSALQQRRLYARTSIQVWVQNPDLVDQSAVSLRGALNGVRLGLPLGIKMIRGTATGRDAARWGWALGVLEGHLRYRVLGRPPARVAPPIPPAPHPAEPNRPCA